MCTIFFLKPAFLPLSSKPCSAGGPPAPVCLPVSLVLWLPLQFHALRAPAPRLAGPTLVQGLSSPLGDHGPTPLPTFPPPASHGPWRVTFPNPPLTVTLFKSSGPSACGLKLLLPPCLVPCVLELSGLTHSSPPLPLPSPSGCTPLLPQPVLHPARGQHWWQLQCLTCSTPVLTDPPPLWLQQLLTPTATSAAPSQGHRWEFATTRKGSTQPSCASSSLTTTRGCCFSFCVTVTKPAATQISLWALPSLSAVGSAGLTCWPLWEPGTALAMVCCSFSVPLTSGGPHPQLPPFCHCGRKTQSHSWLPSR